MDELLHRWNRAIVAFVALFVLTGAIIVLLVTADAIAPDFLPGGSGDPSTGSWFQPQLESLADLTGGDQIVPIAISFIVILAMLRLATIEVRSERRSRALMVSSGQEGDLTIEEESVRYLAERTGRTNSQITSLRCRLRVRGKRSATPASIEISCYPRVALGTDVQQIRDDLQSRVKDTVGKLTGLTILRVNVARVKYERNDNVRLMEG